MGREFDQIMREARQAGVKERRSYHQRVDAKRNGRRNRKTRSTASSCRTSQHKPCLWLSGVDESSTGTSRLPVMLMFFARVTTPAAMRSDFCFTHCTFFSSARVSGEATRQVLNSPLPIE